VNRRLIFHELAERELNDAASYYEAQERAGLVAAFVTEVERVLRLIFRQALRRLG
jgi:hypothetical protein